MNWEAISTIAEIVGATAVVVSLIYLAAQIRQNNRQVEEQIRALRLQAYDTAGADFSTLRLHVSGNPQRASVWRRAKDSYSALEPDEKSQANEMLHELMWAYQNIFSRMRGGERKERRHIPMSSRRWCKKSAQGSKTKTVKRPLVTQIAHRHPRCISCRRHRWPQSVTSSNRLST